MNLASVLLRLLLCGCLLINGAGSARASVRMAVTHARTAIVLPAAERADADVPPCHRHHAAANEDARVTTGVPEAPDAGEGCCKGSVCDCACPPASFLATAGVVARTRVDVPAHVDVFAVAYAQPRLPHLIRPPIG